MFNKKKAVLVGLAVASLAVAGASTADASSGRVTTCVHGDVQVSALTSCPFASNIANHAYRDPTFVWGTWHTARIYSPVTHLSYGVTYRTYWYSSYYATITATGPNGIWARFDYEL